MQNMDIVTSETHYHRKKHESLPKYQPPPHLNRKSLCPKKLGLAASERQTYQVYLSYLSKISLPLCSIVVVEK